MEGLLKKPEGVLVVNRDLLDLGHNIALEFAVWVHKSIDVGEAAVPGEGI